METYEKPTNPEVQYALLQMEIRQPSVSTVRNVSGVAYERGERAGIDMQANPVFREDLEPIVTEVQRVLREGSVQGAYEAAATKLLSPEEALMALYFGGSSIIKFLKSLKGDFEPYRESIWTHLDCTDLFSRYCTDLFSRYPENNQWEGSRNYLLSLSLKEQLKENQEEKKPFQHKWPEPQQLCIDPQLTFLEEKRGEQRKEDGDLPENQILLPILKSRYSEFKNRKK